MTPPPRLAPLETMTEEQYRHIMEDPLMSGSDYVALHIEMEAQRLARAREREATLDEVIDHIAATPYHDPIALVDLVNLLVNLKALRDQEEA